MWRGAIGLWTLGCALLLGAVSTGAMAWAMLALAGLCGSVVWLCTGAVVALRRQWTRQFLLHWLVWPAAVGVASLLYVTDLPLKDRRREAARRGGALSYAGDDHPAAFSPAPAQVSVGSATPKSFSRSW